MSVLLQQFIDISGKLFQALQVVRHPAAGNHVVNNASSEDGMAQRSRSSNLTSFHALP